MKPKDKAPAPVEENAAAPAAAEGQEKKTDAKKAEKDWGAMLRGSFFIFFFLGLALVIGVVLWLLSEHLQRSYPTLFVGKYEGGRVRAQKQVEDAFGWGSETLVDKRPDGPARIRFMLRDKAKRPVTGADVKVTFARKDGRSAPLTFTLKSLEPGVYRLDAALPQGPATWMVRVRAMIGETAYQTSEEMDLP